jgi:hypothetical protein
VDASNVVMVENCFECAGGVVVEIRSGPADAAQLRHVHGAEVCGLSGDE